MCAATEASVHTWATTLTRHHKINPHGQPLTPHHFSMLTQDKKFAGVLSYLVRHLRPPEEQRIIKLNLKHASFKKYLKGGVNVEDGDDGESSLGTEGQLRLRAALLDANMAIAAEVKEINLINQRVEEGDVGESEARRQSCTLLLARQKAEEASRQYQRWAQHLHHLHNPDAPRDNTIAATAIAVQRQLKANLTDIEKVLLASISNQPHSPDEIHQQMVCLCECVGDSVEQYGPQAMLGALLGETRAANRALHSTLQDINLSRDARQLRLKCEKDGTFIDERNPEGVVKGVRELLHLMCVSHVQLYLTAHKTNAQAASLTRALATLTTNIATAVKRSYNDEAVSAGVMKAAEGNIALAGERAALSATLALISDLQQRAAQATRAREVVRAKHDKILVFDKKVQEVLATIRRLALTVEDSWGKIEESVGQLKASISASLSLLTSPTPCPSNTMATEGEAYSALPLPYLHSAQCDGLGVRQKVNLSTLALAYHSRGNKSDDGGSDAVSQLSSGVVCWEALYRTVCHHLHTTHALSSQLDRLAFLRAAAHTAGQERTQPVITTQEMKKLKEKVDEHDEKQQTEILRMTKEFEKELAQGTQFVVSVSKLLQDWWKQPAKDITIKKV